MVLDHLTDGAGGEPVAIIALRRDRLADWLAAQPAALRQWVESTGFTADAGAVCLVAGPRGRLQKVLFGLGSDDDPWAFAQLPGRLPAGLYRVEEPLEVGQATWAALAWTLATYSFDRYRGHRQQSWPDLVWPEHADRAAVERMATAATLVRNLVNTPANDMGPEELAQVAETIAGHHGADCRVVTGGELLREGYPAVYAVGQGSSRPPRLIDITWGDAAAPKVTLVGKGVCFDTGGLDLKTAGTMKLMKKDMGGAAHVLGLAKTVMMADLPVRLRVLIPAVENSVSGQSFRPLDVIHTRKGLTVEIGNTDAEGRLVLCDALTEADREQPSLLIDLATLTGAARAALGPELPALFCNDDALAADLLRHAEATADPMWRLPLWKGYRRQLDSKVADLSNVSDSPHAGAITAALFLQEFVSPRTPWAHLDIFAWNPASRPGRPEGGEAQGLRALHALIEERFRR